MVKRVLMVAFHFPPVAGSSGVQRTLRFANYLLEYGWEPTVLTVWPRAYRRRGSGQLADIDDRVRVIRSVAFDTARHFAILGKYPRALARPDPWASWRLTGTVSGLREIRRRRPDVIWSTYPIATAHLIAGALHRATRIPWVADFRDLMVDEEFPPDPGHRRRFEAIEARTVAQASSVVVTAPNAQAMCRDRYPEQPADKWACIRNGFVDSDFAFTSVPVAPGRRGPLKLLHSGILYPSERDPTRFFEALARLKREHRIGKGDVQVVLRATGHDDHHAALIRDCDIADLVKLEPGLAYREALREMVEADGLLLFQAKNCNHQVPAKLYEYFRAGRPILALTDRDGDTARTMLDAGLDSIVDLDDADAIHESLLAFLRSVRQGTFARPSPEVLQRYSRHEQTRELAELMAALSQRSRRC